ncbi:hypothetical protein EYF80_023058 [Liparis tanakae]|uniref:Uncharacterized protein n=1 Tax=Liparis tanakae TaxID=230148 RepID=A0A4Z2HL86_9TELE|nr:hypothetical protein EYF80_023058 [Liparis tanakae]
MCRSNPIQRLPVQIAAVSSQVAERSETLAEAGYERTYPQDVLTRLRLQHIDRDSVGRLGLLTSDREKRNKMSASAGKRRGRVLLRRRPTAATPSRRVGSSRRSTYLSLTMTCLGFPVRSHTSPWP